MNNTPEKEPPIGPLFFTLFLAAGFAYYAGLDLYQILTIFATEAIRSGNSLSAILVPGLRGLLLCVAALFTIGHPNYLAQEDEKHEHS